MEPAIVVILLWLLFGGTHVGLVIAPVRRRLVAVVGEGGFFALFTLVASLTFWALLSYYAAHRFDGLPGLDAGRVPLLRWLLMMVIAGGVVLIVAGLAVYPRLPVALFGQPIGEPRGVERITRHPFFAGMALVGGAHALLAPHLAGAVFMGGFAVLGIAGARHQDARNLATRGRAYADYVAVTSIVPFAAVLAGRQRLAGSELPVAGFAIGLAVAVVLRLAHGSLFAGGGRWIVLAVIAGGGLASVQSLLRSRRIGALAKRAPATATERRLA